MFQQVAKVEFPTLGYWPGVFSRVASQDADTFKGPYRTLGAAGGMGSLGLFETGFDLSGWGLVEWGVVALGGYMVLSTLLTTGRGVKRIRKATGRRRRRREAVARIRGDIEQKRRELREARAA